MELSQEVVSVLAITVVCIVLSICCVSIWFCRCRKDHIQASEEKNDRALQLENFERGKSQNLEAKASIKTGSALEIEKSIIKSQRSLDKSEDQNNETIGQYEERVADKSLFPALQRVKNEENKNKKLDTISEMAISSDSLQRNDSKTNVFNNDSYPKLANIEVDFNPGLNSSINMEKL